jgi:hypothetical protein
MIDELMGHATALVLALGTKTRRISGVDADVAARGRKGKRLGRE